MVCGVRAQATPGATTEHVEVNGRGCGCTYPNNHKEEYASRQLSPGWTKRFYEFSVERGRNHVAFALDGEVTLNTSNATFWDVDWYLIINTAMGGAWPGPPNSSTVLPALHVIDSVKVTQRLR